MKQKYIFIDVCAVCVCTQPKINYTGEAMYCIYCNYHRVCDVGKLQHRTRILLGS